MSVPLGSVAPRALARRERTEPAPPVLTAKLRPPARPAFWRHRLDPVVERVRVGGLALVVAPAGTGKTTFLAQLGHRLGSPVAWYRADQRDTSEATFVAYVQRALVTALGLDGSAAWTSVDEIATALERRRADREPGTPRVHLVVDDVHTLEGTAAAAALHRLLAVRPAALGMLLGSRTSDAVDVDRLRVGGGAVVVDAEHLRFRAWEVEAWATELCGDHLTPAQADTLTSATDGWATGVQLFLTATSAMAPTERGRLLSGVDSAARPATTYLARTVLDGLDAELRQFLLVTSVLGVLSPSRCDRFVGGANSAHLLDLLQRRGVFTFTDDGGSTFRYHAVLRAALEAELLGALGPIRVRELHLHAATVLESDGETGAALDAYARAGAWDDVRRLAHVAPLTSGAHRWLDAVPPSILAQDPRLQAVRASHLAFAGDLVGAHDAFGRANRIVFHHDRRSPWQDQERALAPWAVAVDPADEVDAFRRGVQRAPEDAARAVLRRRGGPHARLAAAACLLLAGDLADAAELADGVRRSPGADAVTHLAATALRTLAHVGAGRCAPSEGARQLVGLADQAASLGVGLAAGVLRRLERPDAAPVGHAASPSWPNALVALGAGIVAALQDRADAVALLDAAAADLRGLDAPVLADWAATFRRPDPIGTTPPADATGEPSSPMPVAARAVPPSVVAATVAIRCLGPFEVVVDGVPADLRTAKPRSLEFLQLLASAAPGGVSRDTLVEALWPGAPVERGTHRLHVTVSSLRRWLSARSPGLGEQLVRHRDRMYTLHLPDGIAVDTAQVRAAVEELHRRERAGSATAASYAEVVALFRGEPLVERATTEWAVPRRRELTRLCTDAAHRAAVLFAAAGDHQAAADVCARALRVDPYDDRLWDLRQRSLTAGGNVLAAAAARREHQVLLGLADLA